MKRWTACVGLVIAALAGGCSYQCQVGERLEVAAEPAAPAAVVGCAEPLREVSLVPDRVTWEASGTSEFSVSLPFAGPEGLPPGEAAPLTVSVRIPVSLPDGTYDPMLQPEALGGGTLVRVGVSGQDVEGTVTFTRSRDYPLEDLEEPVNGDYESTLSLSLELAGTAWIGCEGAQFRVEPVALQMRKTVTIGTCEANPRLGH